MKSLVCSLTLYCYAAFPAIGGDSSEMLRERLLFCSQFVIEDPGPTITHNSERYCCRFANRGHDCHIVDWDKKYS
jgi:hypothetical protein